MNTAMKSFTVLTGPLPPLFVTFCLMIDTKIILDTLPKKRIRAENGYAAAKCVLGKDSRLSFGWLLSSLNNGWLTYLRVSTYWVKEERCTVVVIEKSRLRT